MVISVLEGAMHACIKGIVYTIPLHAWCHAIAAVGQCIPSVLKGMYSYSPYSHLLGNAHHIPQLNLDFRKAFFKRF